MCIFTDNAYACDPRILRFKEEKKEQKLAQKRAKQEAAQQKADEEKRVSIHQHNLIYILIKHLNCRNINHQCLLGFNVAFKHLRSYCDGACLWQGYFDKCAATQKCHAADTGHDSLTCHSIQTQGRPVVVLFIDVERQTGIHNYPF